jgi:hypothetical protein
MEHASNVIYHTLGKEASATQWEEFHFLKSRGENISLSYLADGAEVDPREANSLLLFIIMQTPLAGAEAVRKKSSESRGNYSLPVRDDIIVSEVILSSIGRSQGL